MKNTILWLTAALLAMVPGSAQERSLPGTHIKAPGRGSWSRNNPPLHPEAATAGTTGNGIDYHGGSLMLGTTHIYYIYVGNWSGLDPKGPAILEAFATNVGGSPYFGINTTYFDSTNTNVSNSVLFVNKIQSNYTVTATIQESTIWKIVQQAFVQGLPVDPNGVYFVLTAPDTNVQGFMTEFCSLHAYTSYNGQNIKYAYVGDPNGSTAVSCEAPQGEGPNNDPGADAMVSQIAAQLNKAVTDPVLDGWWVTSNSDENSDLCPWTYGTTYVTATGGWANMRLGAMDFLVQRNWVNASGGYCALSFGPDFTLSVSPSSHSTAQGTTSGAYTLSIVPVNGFNGSVTLTTSGLPTGAVAEFSSSPTTTSSSLKIAVANTVAVGTYFFTITGTSGTDTHTADATLVVTAPGKFTLSASPNPLTIKRGASGHYTVTITRSGGFNSNLTFSVSGLPSKVTHSFSLNPVTGTTTTTTLTISVNQLAVATSGTKITISASGGGLSASTAATLVIK